MEPTDQQLVVRAANRERQRRHRQRNAQKRAHSIEAQRLASERAERMRRGPHFFGESSPGCNANTFADELQIHREFLRALGKEDVKDGETLRTVAKRAFEAWLTGTFTCRSYGPPFYVEAGRSDTAVDVELCAVLFVPSTDIGRLKAAEAEAAMEELE
jgi:hypothetical protein